MKSFTELFIRRPAFTIVVSLVMTIVGILSYRHLPVRWIPSITPPIVSVYTSYPGASASLVESQITTPIESALSSVDGIETITSNSKQGASYVTIEFTLGHNISAAVDDIRSALQRINGVLPATVRPPEIEKADPDSSPIMYLAVSDQNRSSQAVSDYVKQFILPRLQTVDGVATVSTYGEKLSAVRISLDPMKMAASNVIAEDVAQVLASQNVQVPSGQIRVASRNYSVVTNETIKTIKEFNDLIIRDTSGHIIRLKDIGHAALDSADADNVFRVNGKQAVALAIIPQSTANPLDVAKSVKKEFRSLQKTLPQGMQGDIVFDQGTFIQASIYHVYESLFEAVILVLLVIFLFLASWRAAIIPIVTIPVCLIATFAVIDWLGMSINTITLMAFVLAIGLVVDDAIVMLENIARHIESGMKPFAAAIKGSREIVFPIIAMTITLVAVYAPIAFTSGLLGAVFWEFAITLAASVFISGVVALTLSPMMSARLLAPVNHHGTYAHWMQNRFVRLQTLYAYVLGWVLRNKKMILAVLGVVTFLGYSIYRALPAELAPSEDMSEVEVYLSGPRDANAAYTDHYTKKLEAIYQKMPEIKSYGTNISSYSPSHAMQFLSLVPRDQRQKSAMQIVDELNKKVADISGVKVNVSPASSPLTWSFSGDGSSVMMRVMSSADYKTLYTIMQRFIAVAETYPGFINVHSQLKWNGSQFEVSINRDKAADMQVSIPDMTNTISTLLAGRTVGQFEFNGDLYDIIMQMNQASLSDPNVISGLYVRNQSNKMVPIQDIVSVKQTTHPEMLPHFDRMRSDRLFALLAPGYTIADAVKALQKMAQEVLPENTKIAFEGDAKSYLDSSGKSNLMFFLALLFIYLVLVAQFESFIDPLIILLTVPFAMIGGLVMLKLTGGSFSIYSSIAFVTLIGLIAKHGILITEFANQNCLAGKSVQDAVIDAAKLRLRPILMTTAAMVLGALPLAFASGPGAEVRRQIGWVIVGGMLVGTFFSLLVVPVAYTYLMRLKHMVRPKVKMEHLIMEESV